MKLICEVNEQVDHLILTEDVTGKKNHFISGIFLQSEKVNRNGRIYKMDILENEVNKYNENYIRKNRAFGELGHPDGPTINLDRVSHLIVDLQKEGTNFIGKAKILDTPMGKIVKNLLEGGAQLGVSSRGIGSLKQENGVNVVQNDFFLATAADIVADPSAPDAFVQGIMEGKEWIWDNGIIKESKIDNARKIINRSSSKNLNKSKIDLFSEFLKQL